MCRSESVITLLKTGQRSMTSGELAAYSFRGSWSSARCSRPGLLPRRLLLPERRSSRGLLLLCIPVSKKELRSDRLEEIVDPPSCLISSNSEEIWPSRERISWLVGSMGPLQEVVVGFLAAMASKSQKRNSHKQKLTGQDAAKSRDRCIQPPERHSNYRWVWYCRTGSCAGGRSDKLWGLVSDSRAS